MPNKIIRSINYTGRKKIPRDCIDINLKKDGSFNAGINIENLKLSENAAVSMEAYDRFSLMHFDLGTVGNLKSIQNQNLDNIQRKDGIRFRIKITDIGTEHGKILAYYDNLHTVEKENLECIIRVRSDDLAEQIWNVEFDDDGPLLNINNKLDTIGIRELVRKDPLFQSLVFPAILKEVLVKILIIEKDYDLENHEDWKSRWIHFICKIMHQDAPPELKKEGELLENSEDIMNWINSEAIPEFCRYFGWREKFLRSLEGENDEN
jgi:hypothetical protein